MANATPPDTERSRPRRATSTSPVQKSTEQVRQGRAGWRVLIILVVSLALLTIAYFVIHGYYAGTPHQDVRVSPRPIFAATTPVETPTIAPAMISLNQ